MLRDDALAAELAGMRKDGRPVALEVLAVLDPGGCFGLIERRRITVLFAVREGGLGPEPSSSQRSDASAVKQNPTLGGQGQYRRF